MWFHFSCILRKNFIIQYTFFVLHFRWSNQLCVPWKRAEKKNWLKKIKDGEQMNFVSNRVLTWTHSMYLGERMDFWHWNHKFKWIFLPQWNTDVIVGGFTRFKRFTHFSLALPLFSLSQGNSTKVHTIAIVGYAYCPAYRQISRLNLIFIFTHTHTDARAPWD